MGNPYPIEIFDGNQNGRQVGSVTFTDPDNQPGGGSVPDLAAVLAEGNTAEGDIIFDGDNDEFPRGVGSQAAYTGGDAASLFFGPASATDGGSTSLVGGSAPADNGNAGRAELIGGNSFDGVVGAKVSAYQGKQSGGGLPGRVLVKTNNQLGAAGQALVSDGAFFTVFGGAKTGSGAPSGAPAGFLPLYVDTGTDDLYVWAGAAWKGPYVVTP